MNRKNFAAILAGGTGNRVGAGMPKQFIEVAGRTVLEHSVEAFLDCPEVEGVLIVSNPDFVSDVEAIVRRNGKAWSRVVGVVGGGRERSDSSVNAVNFFAGRDVNLLLHDAARPCVSRRIVADVCRALREGEAVNVVVPAVDTMLIASPDGKTISAIPDRTSLRRVQTPQGFRLTTIAEAYRRALADPAFRATDDCGVVFRYMPEVEILLVEGDEKNLKLTYPSDVRLVEQNLRNR